MKKYICNVTCFIGSLILIIILIGIVLPFDKDCSSVFPQYLLSGSLSDETDSVSGKDWKMGEIV